MGKFLEIHRVCLDGNIKRFRELIKEKNFRVNSRDNLNFTPLMCASFGGQTQIVKELLKLDKVQINARSRNGKSALILAATRGYVEIVKLLYSAGANPNIKQFEKSKKACPKKTALNVSVLCGHNNVSNYLKKKKTRKARVYKHWKI